MAFTAVGIEHDPAGASLTTGQATISVITTTAGNMVVMFTVLGSTTNHVTGITGGGCGTWAQIGAPITSTQGVTAQMWWGTVATAGTANATLTFNSSIGTTSRQFCWQQFSAGLGSTTLWSVDTSGQLSNPTQTTVTWPTLTPSSSPRLYVGFVHGGQVTVGTTAGYTYQKMASGGSVGELILYNLAVSATTTPASTQVSFVDITQAALFAAALPPGSPRLLMINQAVNRAACY